MDISKLFWSHQKTLINNLIWDSKCSWSYIKIYPLWHLMKCTRDTQEEKIQLIEVKKCNLPYFIGPLYCFCISFLEAGVSPPSVIRFGFPLTFLQIKARRTHFSATLPQKDCLSSLFSSGRLSSYIVLSDLDIWIEGFLLKIIKILQLFQQLNNTQPFQILEEDSLKG